MVVVCQILCDVKLLIQQFILDIKTFFVPFVDAGYMINKERCKRGAMVISNCREEQHDDQMMIMKNNKRVYIL